MTAFVRYMLGMAMVLALTTASMAADKAIIILDASGSMWGQIDGKPKLEIARETLHNVLKSIPSDLELGFMAYGHREKGNCADIELIVPPSAGTAGAINIAADNLKFLGKTPLTRRRQAGRRSAQIHRGQGDRHPHHRRAGDLQCRPLRARQGARAVRRRFHRPRRRLRADGGRGQAGRVSGRKYRRQIHPGRRRQGAGGCAGRDRRRRLRPNPPRRLNPRRRLSRKSRSSTSCRPSCLPKAAIRSGTAMPG